MSAWCVHDDPFPDFRDNDNMTSRVTTVAGGGQGGWQCRHVNGSLDDQTQAMGTYDYAPVGTAAHVSMDVSPHNANPDYAGGLTQQY